MRRKALGEYGAFLLGKWAIADGVVVVRTERLETVWQGDASGRITGVAHHGVDTITMATSSTWH